jgi:hypothetical protein
MSVRAIVITRVSPPLKPLSTRRTMSRAATISDEYGAYEHTRHPIVFGLRFGRSGT